MLNWESALSMASALVADIFPATILAALGSRLTVARRRVAVALGCVFLVLALADLLMFSHIELADFQAYEYGQGLAILSVILAWLAATAAFVAGRQGWMRRVSSVSMCAVGLYWFVNSWDCAQVTVIDGSNVVDCRSTPGSMAASRVEPASSGPGCLAICVSRWSEP